MVHSALRSQWLALCGPSATKSNDRLLSWGTGLRYTRCKPWCHPLTQKGMFHVRCYTSPAHASPLADCYFFSLCPTGPSLGTGTAVVMSGLWAPAPPTSDEAYELRVDEVRILGPTDAEVSATITFFADHCLQDIPKKKKKEEKRRKKPKPKEKVELTCMRYYCRAIPFRRNITVPNTSAPFHILDCEFH